MNWTPPNGSRDISRLRLLRYFMHTLPDDERAELKRQLEDITASSVGTRDQLVQMMELLLRVMGYDLLTKAVERLARDHPAVRPNA